MTKQEYLNKRNELLNKAKTHIAANELEASANTRKEIEELDNSFETISIEASNLAALDEAKPININDLSKKVEGEIIVENSKTEMKNEEILAFDQFIRTKGDVKNNVTSTDVGVLIPKEVIYQPKEEVKSTLDLAQLVNRVPVTTASGTYPILKRATAGMSTVAELEKNPSLAKPEFIPVEWKVSTYRGHIAVSQESIDDAEVDLMGIIGLNARQQKTNTTNARISAVLKTFTAKTVSDTDGIKDIINTDLDPAYTAITIASQSFFNELDKLKDKNGRYLLSDNIASPSGKQLLGKDVIVVGDDIIGSAKGDKVAFIGDIKEAVFMADRKDIAVEWLQNEIYGKYLGLFTRFDVKAADTNAGFYVTFGAATGE